MIYIQTMDTQYNQNIDDQLSKINDTIEMMEYLNDVKIPKEKNKKQKNKKEPKEKNYSKTELMKNAGIKPSDYYYVDYIITKESSWNEKAINSKSQAYGLCQALPGNKMAKSGDDWKTNPITQLKWCNEYANSRYGSWKKSYEFWIDNGWW